MISVRSPAKINLFLRILRKRSDGYHELASLFQTIDLCDQLRFSHAERDHFTCSDVSLPTDQNNLVIKALNLFRRKTGCQQAYSIHLEKKIPQQAGLGGGSSNAATTLWALNELSGHPATIPQLMEWAAEIGSDISFFLSSGTAFCTGRGEQVRTLPPLPPTSLWIAKPLEGLSTPQVYGRLNVTSLPQRDPEAVLSEFLNNNPSYFNDLEEPAFSIYPQMSFFKEKLLQKGFSTVLMSGSGSCFFCMGNCTVPIFPELTFYAARFVNRKPNNWF